jgi:hypothetical protein
MNDQISEDSPVLQRTLWVIGEIDRMMVVVVAQSSAVRSEIY